MKFSRNWIQEHIEEKMPISAEFCDVVSKKSLEIEGVEEVNGDVIYDIKVLPHRQHDCFSHRGIAREIVTLFNLKIKARTHADLTQTNADNLKRAPRSLGEVMFNIQNSDAKLCPRYLGVRVDNIQTKNSPDWLKNKLESIGQRSISAIVDITNFVINDIGQPMHAFDADKVVGGIFVRLASPGEAMITLDDKELKMSGIETVIADSEGILALAGVKGGKKAMVDENTKSIIFESANFNATATRKSSDLHNIRTDASKRYEAQMTSELAGEGMDYALKLIKEIYPECVIGEVVDIYPRTDKIFKIGIDAHEVNRLLGTNYSDGEIEKTLKQLNFSFEKICPEEKIKEIIPLTLDKPYDRLASTLHDGPHKFSCGSLVNWFYKECGYPSPRVALDMYIYCKNVDLPAGQTGHENLRFGDFVFTNTKIEKPKNSMIYSQVLGKEIPDAPKYTQTVEYMPGTEFAPGIDHVGMYIGDGKVLHTGSAIGKTVIEELKTSEYFKNECWYGRMVEDLSVEQFVISVPFERLDIRIKADVIEEIGRVIGYDSIVPVLPKLNRTGLPHKRLYYETKIKNILIKNGFSEIYTYTFGDKGEVSIVKGLAHDKEKLRTNLGDGVLGAVKMNLHNAPLLGEKVIKVFEFGNVFGLESSKQIVESRRLAIGIDDGAKKSQFTEEVEMILSQIKRDLNLEKIECETFSTKPYVVEINFDKLIESLPEPASTGEPKDYEPLVQNKKDFHYKTVYHFPFIVRDIACWTPQEVTAEDVLSIINKNDNPLIVRKNIFDTFTKTFSDGTTKNSYAFRLVIQSNERTLTDDEANEVANKTYSDLKEKGWEIR